MKLKLIPALAVILLLPVWLSAQNKSVPLGSWRVHLPYQNCKLLTETPDKIYAASEVGFFSLKKNGGESEQLSTINGFTDITISAIKYDFAKDIMVIAYEDCRFDVIKGKDIYPNDDIFRKNILGVKQVNHLYFQQNLVYFSTSFGIVVFDLDKMEIFDSYLNIGPSGSTESINSLTVSNDTIFAATARGVIFGKVSPSVNLSDFNNWKMYRTGSSMHVESFNKKLFADFNKVVYVNENGTWQPYTDTFKKVITNIEVNHNKLVVAEWGGITVEDMNGNAVVTKVNDFNYALLDVDGVIWFGSSQYGLLRIGINGEEGFLPNGPRAAASYNMLGTGKELWVASGSHTNTYAATYSYNRYYHFTGSEWKNAPDNPLINPMFDFTEIAQNPINKNIYFGTHGSGIVELANVSGQPIQTFDSTNSPLQNYGVATVVTGLAFDKTGRMWVSNFGADSALRVRLTNGKWVAFQLQTASAGKILIDAKNYKWLTSPRNISNGIIVYDDNGTPENKADDRIATLNNTPLGGNLPSLSISCMVQTGKGDIWIGSDLGLSVISTPSNVFLNPSNLANRIIIPFEEGSSQGAYLLGNEIINCITIDGGDRRWVGTNNGAYLIDNDGQTVLKHYTKDNSPLLSDQIYTIGIIEETGEVFFGTSRGIVSYQGNATKSSKNFNNLKIFPNPVKENFDGDVSISGLMNNSLVKITDINGNLIFETGSNGGTATWNCRKFNGERPATGVYLVFVINEDGSETSMGKILFIH